MTMPTLRRRALLAGAAACVAMPASAQRSAPRPITIAQLVDTSSSGQDVAKDFAIFAGRREQIGHALKSLSVGGMQEVGAVFASPREARLYREDVARSAASLKLRLATFTGDGDLARLGQRLGPSTPAVLLFIGGTPELVQLTQGLDRQSRQRYVVAMADVNLQTVSQMGGGRSTP